MATEDLLLGECPQCGEAVRWAQLLIEYRRSSGEHAVFAECPGCTQVVAPR